MGLECPGLFASPSNATRNGQREEGHDSPTDNRWEVLEFFMNSVIRAPIPFKLVVHHINEMVGSDRSRSGKATTLFSKEERAGLMECKGLLEDGRERRQKICREIRIEKCVVERFVQGLLA